MAHQVLKHLKSLYIDESGCISGIKEYPQQLSIVSRHGIDYNPDDMKASTPPKRAIPHPISMGSFSAEWSHYSAHNYFD